MSCCAILDLWLLPHATPAATPCNLQRSTLASKIIAASSNACARRMKNGPPPN
jgi:hypothetical protein